MLPVERKDKWEFLLQIKHQRREAVLEVVEKRSVVHQRTSRKILEHEVKFLDVGNVFCVFEFDVGVGKQLALEIKAQGALRVVQQGNIEKELFPKE